MLRALIILSLLLVPAESFAMAPRQPKQDIMIGQQAPAFTLDTLYNGVKTLDQARDGKKAIIFFWATWCPHCQGELKRLNNSIESIKRRGINLILVNIGEAPNDVKAYMQFHTVFLDSFLDPESSQVESYRIAGIPTLYYLDENGIVTSVQHEYVSSFDRLFSGSREDDKINGK